jgi:hypothetical protein
MRFAALMSCTIATLLAATSPALAAWPNQPTANLRVCSAAGEQSWPTIVSDGAGGAFITWQDLRNGISYDIYAQHVLASGAADPAWPADGRALCTATNNQLNPLITTDGAGGAIVTWYDIRSGANYDVYAQHVLASGAVDAAWPVDGRAVCTAINLQVVTAIIPDGAGGAIIAWQDLRGGANYDIYAQHVLASGAVDPAWPLDGRALCTATGAQYTPMMATDGSAGAIVTWFDQRAGTNDIYAQHVLASGAVDPAWPLDGRALCTAALQQSLPVIVSDGAGGAVVAWQDNRGGASVDIYAQHVLASGVADPAWPLDGRALCTATGTQDAPAIATDGAGGAIVTWQDQRSGTSDIYAQHVLASGVADAAWPADGLALCAAANSQNFPMIVPDGAGGAIVTWHDGRSGTLDIYAQHALASGTVDPAWPVDGRALSTATNTQTNPAITADGAGGAIVTWYDFRGGVASDIYAQRVESFGYLGNPEPAIASVRDVTGDNGGQVKVTWNASYLDALPYATIDSYWVLRSVPARAANRAVAAGARWIEPGVEPLAGAPAFLRAGVLGSNYAWELVASQAAFHVGSYSVVAPTTTDSMASGNPRTAFMVMARTAGGAKWWFSAPDSGYSVDNVPPVVPAPFTGQYAAGVAHLHWNPNLEPDLAGYRVYRGSNAGFVPGAANLIASPPDTGYTDVAGNAFVYKLTAVDIHDNESAIATLLPAGTLAVEGGTGALMFALAAPEPNPAASGTTLRFALPRAGVAHLAIYDAAGRVVRVLLDGPQPAGDRAVPWNLRDAAGRTVGAGLYFARLTSGEGTRVRKLAVTP